MLVYLVWNKTGSEDFEDIVYLLSLSYSLYMC